MEGKPPVKISIIVPVFNVINYIHQCVDSLINQTLKEIEIILIDDCSTDGSGHVCDEYSQKDDRVIVIHNKTNLKQGVSRNKGIEKAQGEYLGFVDPDDWIDLDFYEKLYDSAKKRKADIAKTSAIHVFPDGRFSPPTTLNRYIKRGLREGKPLYTLILSEHWAGVYKKDLIERNNIRFPDIRNGQDIVFLMQVSYYAKVVSIVSKTYYYYRQHQKSTTHVKNIPYFESTLQCFKLHVDFVNAKNIDREGYDFLFFRGLIGVTKRFPLFKDRPDLLEYRDEYLIKTIGIILDYKYDRSILLKYLLKGLIRQQQMGRINNSLPFKIARTTINLKRLIRK